MSTSYALFKSKFKKTITESIYNEVVSKSARYYHFLGKENTWTDFLSPFIPSSPTDLPGEPQDNFRYDLHVRRDILSTKLITPSDVAYVVPRYDWIRDTVYDMYDDNIGPVSISGTTEPAPSGAVRLEDAKFYVLTTEYNVYKCINNNYNSKSTTQPSGTSTNTFTTSDGYIWKFMYTIPISLRNRFLSSEYMPVTTALKQQFYSNGAITTVTIENGGSGYLAEIVGAGTISTTPASTAVVGYLTSFNLQVKTGYILKTLSGTVIGTVATVNSNTSITLQANAAVIISSGAPEAFRVTPPVAASVVVTGNGYLGKNPYIITGITGFPSGIGYSVPPNLTFSAPKIISGLQVTATATATVSGGVITLASLQTAGYGYDGAPNGPVITVDPPMGASTGFAYWTASTVYAQNTILQFGRRFYRVSTAGTSGTTGPAHTSGAVANGTATLTFVGPTEWLRNTSYALYSVLTSGSNYYRVTVAGTSGTNAPTGTVEGVSESNGGCTLVYFGTQATLAPVMTKTEANLTPIIANGEVTGIIINDGGIGYDEANIQIVDTNHPATPVPGTESTYAVIKPNFSIGNVDTLQANVELMAIKGTIEVIKVVDGGSGYGSATIKIIGDGTGATASTTPVGGRITKINIINKGSGYTWTDVVITGTGTGAVARAVMSPLRGHGADAIDELNANSLIFYSSFSRVKNQGLLINNDYRKAGLLRNINSYNSTQRFDLDVGSGCILITGKFDVTKLAYDQLLVKKELDGNNYKQYRIVEFNSTQILISVFNNFSISPNDELLTPSGSIISVTSVVERTIDQMSGDLLFLTVRDAFQPTQEQIITLRTVVTV